jgi:hypothetical protein
MCKSIPPFTKAQLFIQENQTCLKFSKVSKKSKGEVNFFGEKRHMQYRVDLYTEIIYHSFH